MTTINAIISSVKSNIDTIAAEGLTGLGLSMDEAVKLVESHDFDIVASSEQNPVVQF